MSAEKYLQKPIIIFGTGRSGTTIISDIIFQHEDLAWHNNYQELFPTTPFVNYFRRLFDNKYWRHIGMNTQNNKGVINYFCFRPIERYTFWEKLTGPRIDFSRGFLINEKATETERTHIRNFLNKLVKFQKRKRLAFKLTGPARMEYLMSLFPDAVFINITRHPVPTVRSWLEVVWSTQITDQLWWTGAYNADELEKAKEYSSDAALFAAFQYRKIMETTEAEITKMKPTILNVRYEDFVKDSKAVITQILDFAGLPASKLVDTYMTEKISVKNRNDRQAKSEKTAISAETKTKIMEIVAPYTSN
jgi:hypothetical protein